MAVIMQQDFLKKDNQPQVYNFGVIRGYVELHTAMQAAAGEGK